MFTKHFFKVLIVFTFIIFLGLVGVFFAASLEGEQTAAKTSETVAE